MQSPLLVIWHDHGGVTRVFHMNGMNNMACRDGEVETIVSPSWKVIFLSQPGQIGRMMEPENLVENFDIFMNFLAVN